jgi:hypothetical protein
VLPVIDLAWRVDIAAEHFDGGRGISAERGVAAAVAGIEIHLVGKRAVLDVIETMRGG